MRWLIGIALVVWLAALALAQGRGGRESDGAPGTRDPVEASSSAKDGEAHAALLAEYRAAVARWQSELRETRRAAGDLPARPDSAFYARFAELARAGSLPAMVWCLERTDPTEARDEAGRLSEPESSLRRALYRRLIAASPTNPSIVEESLVRLLVREARQGLGRDEALALSGELEQAATSDGARAAAWYARARLLAPPGATDPDALVRARELYEQVRRLLPETELARDAEDELWRLDHLAVGKTAPAFTTADAYGNEIGLRDFRSHVVLVHFCRFLEPESRPSLLGLRDLVLEFWDEDFVLLGISSDEDREAFLRLRETDDLLWPVAFEGPSAGAAATAWRVRDWPQSFVLDGEGVVRFAGLDSAELSDAVRSLIEERER